MSEFDVSALNPTEFDLAGSPLQLDFECGTLEISGVATLKPRGSLNVSEARELLAIRSSFGAYNPDGSLAKDTLRIWGEGQFPDFPGPLVPQRLPTDADVVRVVDEPVVWAGGVSDHYGHFLTEFVSRLWPLLPGSSLSDLPVVYCGLGEWGFVHDWLDAFGVRTIDIPERGAVRFTQMYVPEPAWRLDRWVAPEMRDIHRHARRGMDVRQHPSDFLWLSRSGLGRDRVPYDEVLFEWLLAEYMTIVRPEEMTLGEQVGAFEGSRAVAGVLGSGFHTALMAEKVSECFYLCPSLVPAPFVLQDGLLDANSTFLHSLTPATMRLSPGARQPASFRLAIPETVRALSRSVLPDLLVSDPLVAAVAHPERLHSKVVEGSSRSKGADMETAVARVVLDPLSLGARMSLGALFEEEGLIGCALEQFAMVADLTDDYALAPLRAARLLRRDGRFDEAARMAARVLAIDAVSQEARSYLKGSL